MSLLLSLKQYESASQEEYIPSIHTQDLVQKLKLKRNNILSNSSSIS